MLYAKYSAEKNLYTDYTVGGETAPEGFEAIPKEFEKRFFNFFPFAMPLTEGGALVDISENVDARKNAPKPEMPADPMDEIKLAVAELAVTAAQKDAENKLAIAELAEAMMGGAV